MGANAVYDRVALLADVATAAPADGQVLTWVSSTSRWTPETPSGGGGGGTPGGSSGQLQYDNAGAFGGTAAGTYATSGALFTFTALAATDTPVVVTSASGQSADLVRVYKSDGATLLFSLAADGQITSRNIAITTNVLTIDGANQSGVSLWNNGSVRWQFLSVNGTFVIQDTVGNAFGIDPFNHKAIVNGTPGALDAQFGVMVGDATYRGVTVRGQAGQSANLQEWQGSTGTPLATVSENGYFTTRKAAAPADAELANSEAAFWLDDTPGATKFMLKAKDSGGTVRTGSVALT